MRSQPLKLWTATVAGIVFACSSGCQYDSHAERGTALGATYGSILGGIIGHQSGHTGEGALLGAVAGGVTGNAIGDAKDERDAALAHAARNDLRNAVTNDDLIMMSQNGVGDEVIVNSVRTHGGRLDLSPMAIVHLKNSGVNDEVIRGIQEAAESAPPPPPARPAGRRVRTSLVVIEPRPVVGVGIEFGRRPRQW